MKISKTQDHAIVSLLREVLSQVSSDELPLIDGWANSTNCDDQFDGMLGFGGGTELHLVLPVVAQMLGQLASTAAVDLAKKWGHGLADWIKSGRHDKDLDTTALTDFSSMLRKHLRERGFSQQKTAEVVDCVVATMACHPELLRALVTK